MIIFPEPLDVAKTAPFPLTQQFEFPPNFCFIINDFPTASLGAGNFIAKKATGSGIF